MTGLDKPDVHASSAPVAWTPDNAQRYLAALKAARRRVEQVRIGAMGAGAFAPGYAGDPVGFIEHHLKSFLWSKQREICQALLHHDRIAVKSCHNSGKALALNTPLPTPIGWTNMSAVRVGDRLIDEHGIPCTVIAVSSIEHKPCYRVQFDDRTSIVAASDHLWSILTHKRRRALRVNRDHRHNRVKDWRTLWDLAIVRTTDELFDQVEWDGQSNWSIPCSRPLVGSPIDFPIPPYTFGAWLGDGTNVRPNITIGHQDADEMLSYISSEGITHKVIPSAWRVNSAAYKLKNLSKPLRQLGLWNHGRSIFLAHYYVPILAPVCLYSKA